MLLLRLTRRERRELVAATIERLHWHGQQVRQARSADRIRGLEGSAAAEYFTALGRLLEGDGFAFLGRHRRPPTTPFDALCGFGYAVLWNGLLTRIELQGLDPYEGVLHVGSARDGGIFLDEATRRLWLKTWSTYMGERVTLADGRQGPRWELVDGLVRAFVRFVYAPVDGLVVPQRL